VIHDVQITEQVVPGIHGKILNIRVQKYEVLTTTFEKGQEPVLTVRLKTDKAMAVNVDAVSERQFDVLKKVLAA
jgi:hypothetical protein